MAKYCVLGCFFVFFSGIETSLLAHEEGDILDYLPAILANVEKKPPPPPDPAEWKITNTVYCPTFRSDWTVSDGTTSRESSVRGSVIFFSNTSEPVSVAPGERSFNWTLQTNIGFSTCGFFANGFTRVLVTGYSYEFILEPNGSGGLSISTDVTKIN